MIALLLPIAPYYLAIALAFAVRLLWLEPPRGLYVLQYFAAALFGLAWPGALVGWVLDWRGR